MKRVFLIVSLAFLLTGCKNTAVKDTEDAINNIGTVSLDNKTLVYDARANYDALTDNQKDKVENYKILLDAEEKLVILEEEENAKQIANEINNLIDKLYDQLYRSQAEVDKLNELYNSLKEEYKDLVPNSDRIKQINELTQYEAYALAAANEVKENLKASDSFKLKELSIVVCDSDAISPYFVSVRYSGTNSFGGEIDSSAFVDINAEGESIWWSLSALLGGLEENELLLYGDSLDHKINEYELYVERIIKAMS